MNEYVSGCSCIHFSGSQTLPPFYFHLLAVLEGELFCSSSSFHSDCYQIPGSKTVIFTSNGCQAFHLMLKPQFLLDHLNDTWFFTRKEVTLPETASRLLHLAVCQYAYQESLHEASNTFKKASVLCEILQILKDNTISADSQTPPSLFGQVVSYIEANYSKPLGQADTAAHFSITPQYLSRLMNLHAGKTFRKFLEDVRMQKAKAYLKYTQLPLDAVCDRTCLCKDAAVFSNTAADRESIPTTPSPFGTAVHTPIPEPVPKEKPLKEEPSSSLYAPCAARETTLDLNVRKPMPAFWNRLINLGYAPELKKLHTEKQLELLQKKIGFTYGRICRITDLIRWHNTDNRKLYNFTSVFSLLDVILQKGLLPFLELGNKVFLIQTTASNSLALDKMVDSIQYYDQLLELLPEFVRACINRYGQECFDRWKFEISYAFLESEEIENFRPSKYLEYFQKIYAVLRSYSPTCQIGGPGYNDWGGPDTLKHFLGMFARTQHSPDFFSAYLYMIDKTGPNRYAICKDPSAIKKRLNLLQEEVSRVFPGKKIWITEFNSNLSSRNHLNDLSYQASFLAKTFLDVFHSRIEAMGYYLLSDSPLRYSDSLDFLFGGWGLFSDTHIPKPSYYAYRMLSLLGSYLVKHTEHYILTQNSKGSFQLLVSHYAHPAEKYLQENIQKEDVSRNAGHLFMQVKNSVWRFHLLHIPSGKYLVKEYRISPDSCSLFQEWENMGFFTPSRQWELDDLYHLSMLAPKLSVLSVKEEEPLILECRQNQPGICLYLVELYS